jgi:hypothetical protein
VPLTDQEKERVRYHLGYPQVRQVGSASFGIVKSQSTAFLLETSMQQVMEAACDRVRAILNVMDGIERREIEAQKRLAASQIDTLKLREDELPRLRDELKTWGYRLADLLGVPVYPLSTRYRDGTGAITNVPVRR